MSAQKNKQMDMLNGPLLKKILIFALPLAASSILQQLFNSADVAVVGRFAGSKSLAAVVAIATVIADCVSASLVTYFLMTGDEMVRFNPKKMSLKKEEVIKIIKIGAPAGFDMIPLK